MSTPAGAQKIIEVIHPGLVPDIKHVSVLKWPLRLNGIRNERWWIYFTALGMLAAAELYRRLRGVNAVACAKLHHQNRKRCHAFQTPDDNAEASVRAGFMLTPDRGASRLTYIAIKIPASTPVRAGNELLLDAKRITVIKKNEMTNSAAKAAAVPAGPGTVTT